MQPPIGHVKLVFTHCLHYLSIHWSRWKSFLDVRFLLTLRRHRLPNTELFKWHLIEWKEIWGATELATPFAIDRRCNFVWTCSHHLLTASFRAGRATFIILLERFIEELISWFRDHVQRIVHYFPGVAWITIIRGTTSGKNLCIAGAPLDRRLLRVSGTRLSVTLFGMHHHLLLMDHLLFQLESLLKGKRVAEVVQWGLVVHILVKTILVLIFFCTVQRLMMLTCMCWNPILKSCA